MIDRRLRCLGWLLLAALSGCDDGSPEPGPSPAAPGPSGIRYLAQEEGNAEGFARALEPRAFEFPADHLPHPDFRTEWWYFTGNVTDSDRRSFGFELTVFRIALGARIPSRQSDLATNQIWMGNLAVTDAARRRFQTAERLSRGARGLAGAALLPDAEVDIDIEDWSIRLDGDRAELRAADGGFGLDLELTGLDRIVPQGVAGLDAKGPEAGNASYYFSSPRLTVGGEIRSDGKAPVTVEGTAWMDREWSTSALSPDLVGWDWFALQLDDGRDLMFYRLRARDGSTSRFSGGSLSDAAGHVERLTADDVSLAVTRQWTSDASGIRYPVAWELAIPAQELEVDIRPRIDAQELDLSVRYWEGAVTVQGHAAGRPVSGVGYLELAGY